MTRSRFNGSSGPPELSARFPGSPNKGRGWTSPGQGQGGGQAKGRVTVAYGQRVRDLGRVMSTIKQEMKSSMISNAAEPGVITFDGDMSTGYVYAQVNLLLNLDDYFDGLVQTSPISRDLYAAVHSLSRYLSGRIGA